MTQARKTSLCLLIMNAILVVLVIFIVFFPFKALYRRLFKTNDFRLEISEPIIVAQALPSDEQIWGIFQFPRMCFTDNGNILLKIANKPDSINNYDGEYLYYISEDQGKTWRKSNEEDTLADCTLLMENEMYFQGPKLENAYDSEVLSGAIPLYSSANGRFMLFDAENVSVPNSFASFEYDYKSKRIETFDSQYSWDKRQLAVTNGFLLPGGHPFYHFEMHSPNSIIKEKEGSLLAAVYGYGGVEVYNSENLSKYNVYFLRSNDNGRTWNYVSSILSEGICAEESEGLCEPCLTVTPDGQYIVLMRSGSGLPSYISYSSDNGESWSVPIEFDTVGVDPQLITLDCGATLASYGRPGVYVRATDDKECIEWKIPEEISMYESTGENYFSDSCCYTSLIQIDKYTALLAYSDFTYPSTENPEVKVKTIVVRKIHINYNY